MQFCTKISFRYSCNSQKYSLSLHSNLQQIVMMEERRKDEATLASEPANPLAMLDQLGDMVKATGKTSEQLVGEHLAEKYNL